MGDSIQVKDLPEVEGYTILNTPGAVVARVQVTRAARMSTSTEASDEEAEAQDIIHDEILNRWIR